MNVAENYTFCVRLLLNKMAGDEVLQAHAKASFTERLA